MRLYKKILMMWCPFAVINFAGVMAMSADGIDRVCVIVLAEASALVGSVSWILSKKEAQPEIRALFVNLAVVFFINGFWTQLYQLAKLWWFPLDTWAGFYEHQYRTQLYFLLLAVSVVFLVVHLSFQKLRLPLKYFIAVSVVGTIWISLFYAYYANPKYLYTTTDIKDYKAIQLATQELHQDGMERPSLALIASVAPLTIGIRPENQDVLRAKEARVLELWPYCQGDAVYLLVYRPLWRSCVLISLLLIGCILVFIIYQFIADPPKSAYLEKILWCLLVFCSCEALHHYAFTTVRQWDAYAAFAHLGMYLSTGIMIVLLFLFILRLRFIQSVEGRFYEIRLATDASRITRWRDAFDNWVLRQFMNPNELDQRFLIQPKDVQTKDVTKARTE
ncbi:MAG: hypothetical protein NTU47_17300 [Ignavibacteriales bacterium]|nr:hypothetical protein [Ignavibacteriales bacterium]